MDRNQYCREEIGLHFEILVFGILPTWLGGMGEQAETKKGYVSCSRINLMINISGMPIMFVQTEAQTAKKYLFIYL